MAASRSSRAGGAARGVAQAWRLWSPEQRVAAVAATLLIVSTFGPFSFVELAIALVGVSILWLLGARAQGREFHLPFGDGTVIAAAGLWCGLLIVLRVFDRPLGQNLLALGCALLLFLAGARQRSKRPADDLPAERDLARHRELARRRRARPAREAGVAPDVAGTTRPAERPGGGDATPLSDPTTRPIPREPPEMPAPGQGRRLMSDPVTRPLPEDPPEMPRPGERRGDSGERGRPGGPPFDAEQG